MPTTGTRCGAALAVLTLLGLAAAGETAALAQVRADGPPFLLVGLDGKTFFRPQARNGPEGHDALAVIDIGDAARPRLAHLLALPNSVYGPPTNLQITPDGRLGLVASSVVMQRSAEGEPWYARPDDRLHVIDLAADPPRLVETLQVGRQPSGLAIHPDGRLALVANRAGRSVTVLGIAGTQVTRLAEVDLGEEAAGVAITPDGRRALAVRNMAGKLAVLRIEGQTVTPESGDLPVGRGVYSVDVTPDGRIALTADTGPPSDGHADTATVIRMGETPRVVGHVTVADTPEVLAVSPDGRHAVAVAVRGSSVPHASPTYTRNGSAVLLAIGAGGDVRAVGEAEVGALPEGVAFAPDGRHLYVGNYVDRTLSVLRIEGEAIVAAGPPLALPGQPASVGGRARGARDTVAK